MTHIGDKNPKCNLVGGFVDATPPSHGCNVCELIMKQVDDKEPRDAIGWTPLHYAAKFGCVKNFEMIMKAVSNRNPMSNVRATQFYIAAR